MVKKQPLKLNHNYWFKLLLRSLIAMILLTIISSMLAFSSFLWVESVNSEYKVTQLNILGKIIIAAGRVVTLSINQVDKVASSSAAMITDVAKSNKKNVLSEVYYSLKNKLANPVATSTKPSTQIATTSTSTSSRAKNELADDIKSPPVQISSTTNPVSASIKKVATSTVTATTTKVVAIASSTIKAVEEPIAGANNPPTPKVEPKQESKIPPDTLMISTPVALSSSTQANFTIDANEAGCTFEYKLNSDAWVASGKSIQLNNLATGSQAIKFRAISAVNGTDASPTEYNWSIDLLPPVIVINSAPTRYFASSSVVIDYAANEPVSGWYYKFDTDAWRATTSQHLVFSDLSENDHLLKIYGIDAVGITSEQIDIPWFVDLTAPTAYIDPLATEFNQTGFELTYYGLDNQAQHGGVLNYDIEYNLDGGEWLSWLNSQTEEAAIFNVAVYPGREIYFRVKARDQAGHASDWSEIATTRIAAPNPNYLLISEIQFSGGTPDDEFIELYNPTSQAMYLENYSIVKKTPDNETIVVVPSFENTQIDAHRYLLLASVNYDGAVPGDIIYSDASIENNDTIILLNNGVASDKFGAGNAADYEAVACSELASEHQSVERKAVAKATSASMGAGGLYQYHGNSFDTDNNSFDFVLRSQADPQNIDSPEELVALNDGYRFVWNNSVAAIGGICSAVLSNWLNGSGLRVITNVIEGVLNQAKMELWESNRHISLLKFLI